tara:strand:- start:794 stop:1093 length:300 start_codon:yes stop_codon:yes gene_type:complete
MKKLISSIFSTLLIFPLHLYSNELFSVEIEALRLIMNEYSINNLKPDKAKFNSPSYMAYKQDECNAKVEVTEKSGLQVTTLQSFIVNICKKEINRTLNN